MIYLILIGIVLSAFLSVTCRVLLLHLLKTCKCGIKDMYYYFKHLRFNNVKTGRIIAYTGLFGRGKTLSAVHTVTAIYRCKDGKKVWCPERRRFVVQRVKVLSNVALKIPYECLVSLEQVVRCAERNKVDDMANETLTVTLVLGDEFSVQLNSRSFKSNINPLFLNTMLTCRHHHISMYYTAQRFGHVDALLRQVTQLVIDCRKVWRAQCQYVYDAWDIENATSANMVKPLQRTGWFVTDKDYDNYDTLACVKNLKKSFDENDMMSDEEILQLQCNNAVNMEVVSNVSRKYKRRMKGKG